MLCSYLGILRVGTQPLTALMKEKLSDQVVKTGLITMTGSLKYSREASEEAMLTDPIEQFKNGVISLIIGHPESWLTVPATSIIETLKHQEMIVFSFIDEFQMNLSTHWGKDFR